MFYAVSIPFYCFSHYFNDISTVNIFHNSNRENSTGKSRINNRVENVEEITEDKEPVEMRNIQSKAKAKK